MTGTTIGTALTVLVFGAGGPGGNRVRHPIPRETLGNGTITITQGSKTIATSNIGNLTVKLEAGTYQLQAGLEGSKLRCSAKTVRLGRRVRTITVRLSCPTL
jgi:hypothetical protein